MPVDSAANCANIYVTWSSVGSPSISTVTGNPVVLETTTVDFDDLVGAVVTVQVRARVDGGLGDVSDTRNLTIGADPFVAVSRTSRPSVVDESGVVDMEVTLRNQTTCDVTGIQWREVLSGLRFLDNTALTSDGGAPGTLVGNELVFDGLALPAGASVTLSYSAQHRFLERPMASGEAWKGQARVSAAGLGSRTTCGCGSAANAGPVLGLVVASILVRRRRATARS
jgi:uncharacterized protein (TIGR03382 family)